MPFVFSSESVTEGHPDKVADRISDAVLDAHLRGDPYARVACESLVATEFICLAGEITSAADVDYEAIARRAIKEIGYDSAAAGIGWDTAEFTSRIVPQSPDIAKGVGRSRSSKRVGAGDQGMMFGYAEAARGDGTAPDHMPVPISLAHGLTRRLTELRRKRKLTYLRPDGKSQVSVRFEKGKPVAVDAVVLAAQHKPEMSRNQEELHEDLREHCIRAVVPEEWLHKGTKYFINHTGEFETGGPRGDCGLTGRKIIVDTYGGWIPHGGGAFSGKDPTKVDRSAAYYARYAAKNLVAAGLAKRLQIQVAYSIGSVEPVSLNVNAFGTGKKSDEALERILRNEFDFSPGAIIEQLGLRAPLYTPVTAYGHFGRTDLDLPWERTDRAKRL
ncbi:MAG TPA: methionine adenosyltransferase [Candidatus Thermoplasmatota archaeon]|nr:methionine adenosyltransferase [Candidatus Thermoplasmatota archaeon]